MCKERWLELLALLRISELCKTKSFHKIVTINPENKWTTLPHDFCLNSKTRECCFQLFSRIDRWLITVFRQRDRNPMLLSCDPFFLELVIWRSLPGKAEGVLTASCEIFLCINVFPKQTQTSACQLRPTSFFDLFSAVRPEGNEMLSITPRLTKCLKNV